MSTYCAKTRKKDVNDSLIFIPHKTHQQKKITHPKKTEDFKCLDYNSPHTSLISVLEEMKIDLQLKIDLFGTST